MTDFLKNLAGCRNEAIANRPVDPSSTLLTAYNDADFFVRYDSPLFLLLAREEKWRKLVAGQ